MNLKTPALRFSVDGKQFENEALWKRWRYLSRHFPDRVFLKHKSKMTDDWTIVLPLFSELSLIFYLSVHSSVDNE